MEPRKRKILHYRTPHGTIPYQEWMDGLRDSTAHAAILKRIDRVEEGLLGDRRYVGEGVWEFRIDCGPGYRVYYGEDGPLIIILLLGGDKGNQRQDIRKAREFWADYRRNP